VYYRANIEKFKWPERVDFAEIQVKTDSLAKAIYARLAAGEDFSQLAEQYTVRPGYADKKGRWGLVAETLNKLSRAAAAMAVDSIAPPALVEGKWSIVEKLGSDSVHTKTFEEALAEVTSGYQEYAAKEREQEWVQGLRTKYGVEVNRKPLATAFMEEPRVEQ
jgi:parvulin-like peptidyl-prolyl isomerase